MIERKLNNLEREIRYYSRVYPGCNKLKVLKSIHRHYKKLTNMSNMCNNSK